MRGRRSFNNPPNFGGKEPQWDEDVIYIASKEEKGTISLHIRPFGGYLMFAWHWPRFKSKTGKEIAFPIICSNFDFYEGVWLQNKTCGVCEHFSSKDLPDSLRFGASYRYMLDAFNLNAIDKGQDGVSGAIQLGTTAFKSLQNFGKITKSGAMDNPKDGLELVWTRNNKAPKGEAKDSFINVGRLPIKANSDETKFKIKRNGKIYTAECQDFGPMLESALKSYDEVIKNLDDVGLMGALDRHLSSIGKKSTRKRKVASANDYNDAEDDDFEDFEDSDYEEEDTPEQSPPPGPVDTSIDKDFEDDDEEDFDEFEEDSSDDDDDDWDDEDDSDSSDASEPKSKADDSSDDDDDWDEDWDDGDKLDEPSPAPQQKKSSDDADSSDDDFDDEFGDFDDDPPKAPPPPKKKKTHASGKRKRSRKK